MSNVAQCEVDLIEVEFEAQGETLTLRDSGPRRPEDNASDLDGTLIEGGTCVPLQGGTTEIQIKGSVSVYAGREKIGILNWDRSKTSRDVPVAWTSLSKNYGAAVCAAPKTDVCSKDVRVRVSRKRASVERTGISVGHLGFAGL